MQYVFARETRELESLNGVHSWASLSSSLTVSSHPEQSRVVRVDDFEQCVALQSAGAKGSKGELASDIDVVAML